MSLKYSSLLVTKLITSHPYEVSISRKGSITMKNKGFEKAKFVNFNPERALKLLVQLLAAQEGIKVGVKVEKKQSA
jgi:hypothetical protein